MILVQDEVIMKQFIFTLLSWTLPDGSKPLIPKDEGMGLMISAFTCRELGFAHTVPSDIMEKVNKKRMGEMYSDEKAANVLFGSAAKKPLTRSPFLRQLEYGTNKEGYWSYEHMTIQLEHCIDVLKIQFPQFDFLFLVDHSNGHDRLQPDGLSITKIGVKYGGKQPKMRSTNITSKDLLGPFHNSEYALQVGSTQVLQFSPLDTGPCYLTEKEREERRFDRKTGSKRTVKYKKLDLVKSLRLVGVKDPKGSSKKLQQLARFHNLPVSYEEDVVDEGWVGKPKGALQILYERGWIDPDKIGQYTKKGRKTQAGVFDGSSKCEYSLDDLMQKQTDFKEELTLLQFHAAKLGVVLDRSPKCHPEIAGEGIEYAWAFSKQEYRRAPVINKRTKEKFWKLVESCMSNSGILSLDRMRLCSKKARTYMLLYKAVESVELENIVGDADSDGKNMGPRLNKHSILEDSLKLYRQLQQKHSTHRTVRVMDIRSLEKELEYDNEMVNKNDCDSKKSLVRSLVKKMVTL